MYPSLEEAKELAKRYNRIPLYRELNLAGLTMPSLLKALCAKKDVLFLESAREDRAWSRFSFLGINPRRVVSFSRAGLVENGPDGPVKVRADFFDYLEDETGRFCSPTFEEYGSFNGGLVGFFSYELVNHCGILRGPVPEDPGTPLAMLAQIEDFIVYDNVLDRYSVSTPLYADGPGSIDDRYDDAAAYLEKLEANILYLVDSASMPYLPARPDEVRLAHRCGREEYMAMVEEAKEQIAAGEIIQAVVSARSDIVDPVDPFRFYLKLRSLNPSPYMFFLKFNDLHVVGSSPEIHVKVEGRRAVLRPIAGTSPKGTTPGENESLKAALLADPKERAEHLMLVDLARNDLGRVAAPGTVKVESFMLPEDYSHVIHLVSVVTAELSPEKSRVDVLKESFPAGTVTGAPKVRAIEIISGLEPHPRGIYAGAVGYLGYNGVMDTCIAIRTAVFNGRERYLQAGAGIVYDSVPEKEFEETRNKLRALSLSLGYAAIKEEAPCF
ncbi:MAG TPA: anthranilate synthase component I family protein [Spirochaetes bacterium]|nr:anthranilate synthase component I family protein [Spirochaetota bacterium]